MPNQGAAMRELLSLEPGSVSWHDYQESPLQPDEVRVKSLLTAVKHGTEAGLVKRTDPTLRKHYDPQLAVFVDPPGGTPPLSPIRVGNMTFGRVLNIGEAVQRFRVGDLVYGWLGIRETHTVREAQLFKLPEGVRPPDILCLDPADYALCGIRDSRVGIGDRVAVFGLGAIGLMAVQLLRTAGAREIIAVDPVTARRELALRFGATLTLDPTTLDVGLTIKERTGGGVDVALELSGNARALSDAIRATRFAGTITTVGLYRSDSGPDLGWEWHFNRQTLIASRSMSEPNRDYPRWERARLRDTLVDLFRRGALTSDGVLEPIVSFGEAREAYLCVLEEPSAGIKLTVRYEN